MSLAQLVRLRRLGWTGHVLRHNDLIVHIVELWCQTWLVTSVSSATSPVRTAQLRRLLPTFGIPDVRHSARSAFRPRMRSAFGIQAPSPLRRLTIAYVVQSFQD